MSTGPFSHLKRQPQVSAAVAAATAPQRSAALPFTRRLATLRNRSGEWLAPFLYLAPLVALLAVFTYWPLVFTAYLSFVDWNFVSDERTFVGFANYTGLVHSSLFAAALHNTGIYVIASIPLKVLLPVPIAVFIWSMSRRVGDIYKSIVFLPTLLSFVVVAIAFGWLLNPYFGLPEKVLKQLGLRLPHLLMNSELAIWTILGISTWKVIGFNVLLYLAGLASINREYIEAMRLDGAGDWRLFRHLIWPLLTPTTFFVLISTVIFSLNQVFTPIDILTQGGPSNSTTNLFYMVYQYAFLTFNTGFASAGAVMLFLLLAGVAVLKIRLLERWVHYR